MSWRGSTTWMLFIVLSACAGSDSPPSPTMPGPHEPPPPALLSVHKSGDGLVKSSPAGIDCGSTCSADFANETSVTLTAVGTAGSTFAGWSGGCTGNATCVIVMDAAQTVSATFTPPPSMATLTVADIGTGSGTVNSTPGGITQCTGNCTAEFIVGTTVTLTAVPTTGSTFTGWSATGCSGTGACTVVLNVPQTITATFTKPVPVMDLTIYGTNEGLTGTVIDAGPDDAQNIWAATPDALYVLQPGQTTFKRFTEADGLHLQSFTDPNGQTTVSRITAMAGGHTNEVFVGYKGFEGEIPPPAPPPCCVPHADFSDPRWSLGQADKVTLNPDGTIRILRYLFRCDVSANCWEERSVRRMTFAHQGVAAGHLFIGFDHGVTHVFNDTFGDHIHVETIYHFLDNSPPVQKQGEQYGLFVLPTGDLLTGGAYGVGLQKWNPDPRAWVNEPFRWTFTIYGPAEPYNQGPHSLDVPAGYREDQRGVAMTADGTAWFASLTQGLASYPGGNFDRIQTYTTVPGLPPSGLIDMAADPDGTLWIVDSNGRLLRFDPSTLAVQVWPGISGARRVVMDTAVHPRAVYVAMGANGLAVIRVK
jgi:Divergent InlB B-repeat domain